MALRNMSLRLNSFSRSMPRIIPSFMKKDIIHCMCGRYRFFDEKNPKLKEIIETAKKTLPSEEFAEISLFEVFPSQKCFVGYWNQKKQEVRTTVMKWGYTGFHDNTVINARSETCFTSRFFNDSLPCAIPASSYFEWSQNPHRKYEFTTEEQPVYLAGIFHQEKDGNHFVILTEEAGQPQRQIHSRQPVMFPYEKAREWCAFKHPSSLLSCSIQKRIIIA